ncbi:MMPL family transporter [Solihabitans fulvus]|uniref:MMPL family transporter n=1 Tax=Solihabitans fulvus TaxID=1892852 RepID=UPI001661D1C5|nr:MMPL family transporter [Solihabitans fulvus]
MTPVRPAATSGPISGGAVERLGWWAARRRDLVAGVWLLVVAASFGLLPHFTHALAAPAIEIDGSESSRAAELVAKGFPLLGREQLVVAFRSTTLTSTSPDFQDAVGHATAALRRQPGVRAAFTLPPAGSDRAASDNDVLAPLYTLYHDPHNAYVLVALDGDSAERQDRIRAQRDAVTDVARAASDARVQAHLIGLSTVNEDMRRTELDDLRVGELVTIPLAALVLLVGLGTVGAAVLPLLTAGAAIVTTFGLVGAATLALPGLRFDTFTAAVVTVVGLGIGIDYALFVVNRFREELSTGIPPEAAVGRATATSGRAVVLSGIVVSVAAASMVLLPSPLCRELALGATLVTAVVLLAALTLLPAILVRWARWVEWGRLPWFAPSHPDAAERGGWARWARRLMRRPWPYAVAGIAVLLLASLPVSGLRLGVDLGRQGLADTPSGAALAIVDADGAGGVMGMISVVVPRISAGEPAEVATLAADLRQRPDVAAVLAFDNRRDLSMLAVVPRAAPDSAQAADLTRRLRGDLSRPVRQARHEVVVGGFSALLDDVTAMVTGWLPWVIGLVLLLSLGYLVVVFRSLVLPVKAIVMNLLAISATLGLTALVFQHGFGASLAGARRIGSVQVYLPVVVFTMLFGLSMDYEVFLVRRIHEEYQLSGDNSSAVALGLQRTARSITTAAAIMIVIFSGLLANRIPEARQIGFALAVAVAVDATVIRMLLVPTLMRLLGDRNWWLPRPLDRLLGSRGQDA